MGDAGCISYTFPFINLPRFISALLALSSAPRLYLPMPVCKSLPRGYNNPWERFCWLTSVKVHRSPGIKLGQPEALVKGGAGPQQPYREDVLRTQPPWEAARPGVVCQPRSCLPAPSCNMQTSGIVCSSHCHRHGLSRAKGQISKPQAAIMYLSLDCASYVQDLLLRRLYPATMEVILLRNKKP